jgi:hypothetical protein
VQGAGQVNFSRALFQYIDPTGTHDVPGDGGGHVAKIGFDLGALSLLGHNDYILDDTLDAGDMMDVTLTWFRDRSVDDGLQLGIDDGQANLDLQIWDGSFSSLLASSQSLYNTSEELHFFLPASGLYGIRVIYTDQLFGTPLLETFGLAWDVTAVPEPTAMICLVALLPMMRLRRRCSSNTR